MFARNFKCITLIACCLLLSACATPYQSYKFRLSSLLIPNPGGYKSEKGPEGSLKVIFYGNRAIQEEKVIQYTLLRIAQIGEQKHKKYIALYQTFTDVALGRKSFIPAVNMTLNAPTGYAYVYYSNQEKPGDLSVDKIYKKYAKYLKGGALNEVF